MEDTRKSAEEFLDLIKKSKMGKLKIYIGMSAGVGKTFRMLSEAHLLIESGIDVRIGYVETHNILYNFLNGILLAFDSYQYEKIKKEMKFLEYSMNEYFQVLLKHDFILEGGTDEVVILKEQHIKALKECPVSIAIAPTLSCNFSCYYCYQDREESSLSKETADIIIDQINQKFNNRKIVIEWIGGEPLLNFEIMKYISEKLHSPFASVLITNGYLIDDLINELDCLNLAKIQITLDGNIDTHDSIRFSKNDKSTFKKIISNIHLFVEKYPQVFTVIRTNVKNEDSFDLKNFLSLFNSLRGKVRLNFSYIQEKEVLNGNEDEEYPDISTSFYEDVLESGFAVYKLPRKSISGHCPAYNPASFAISSNGQIHKCVGMLGTKNLILGRINQKHININEEQQKKINQFDIFLNEICTNCPIFPFCMGGCLNSQLRKQNEIINVPCPYFKNNINKAKSMISNYYSCVELL